MNLERMLKAAGQNVPSVKPVLEINVAHPIVQRLKTETDNKRFTDWSQILFDQATLAEGGHLEDPAAFVKRLNELMLTLAGEGAVADLDTWGIGRNQVSGIRNQYQRCLGGPIAFVANVAAALQLRKGQDRLALALLMPFVIVAGTIAYIVITQDFGR